MRELVMLLTVVALLLATVAGVALAKDAHMCTGAPCTGTNRSDNLWEYYKDGRRDVILGLRGDDRLHAETNNRDRDELRGQGGSDILNVADGDEKTWWPAVPDATTA